MFRSALLLFAAAGLAFSVAAQVQRAFPQNALRGALIIGEAPEIALNGQPARLAPGARIRDADNMSVVPGTLIGGRFLVHYTADTLGLVKDVWILRPDEAARLWPSTIQQAQAWSFDPAAQVWLRP